MEDNLTKAIELYEKTHIERTLGKTAGDKIRAAELLGLSLSTLYRKIEKLEIEDRSPAAAAGSNSSTV